MTRTLQKLIHVGCRELGLDSDDRKAMQLALTGKASMADMSEAELTVIVDNLKAKGFKPKGGRKPKAPRKDLRLVHVLWSKLGEAGVLERPDRAGLNAFIRKRFEKSWGSVPADVDMLRDHTQIDDVIQALKSWATRVATGFDPNEAQR
ncbi:gp16 family protein [Pseudaestuariivita sp.]|uniref:gp16 family protein n=1 Tax=Pseudaestuariivita sp. TaxID=2211669 RepID=UPI0040591BD7